MVSRDGGGGKGKLFIDGEISFQYSCMLLKPTERNNKQLKQCPMKIDHSTTRLNDNLGLNSIRVRQSNLDLHNKQEIYKAFVNTICIEMTFHHFPLLCEFGLSQYIFST